MALGILTTGGNNQELGLGCPPIHRLHVPFSCLLIELRTSDDCLKSAVLAQSGSINQSMQSIHDRQILLKNFVSMIEVSLSASRAISSELVDQSGGFSLQLLVVGI